MDRGKGRAGAQEAAPNGGVIRSHVDPRRRGIDKEGAVSESHRLARGGDREEESPDRDEHHRAEAAAQDRSQTPHLHFHSTSSNSKNNDSPTNLPCREAQRKGIVSRSTFSSPWRRWLHSRTRLAGRPSGLACRSRRNERRGVHRQATHAQAAQLIDRRRAVTCHGPSRRGR